MVLFFTLNSFRLKSRHSHKRIEVGRMSLYCLSSNSISLNEIAFCFPFSCRLLSSFFFLPMKIIALFSKRLFFFLLYWLTYHSAFKLYSLHRFGSNVWIFTLCVILYILFFVLALSFCSKETEKMWKLGLFWFYNFIDLVFWLDSMSARITRFPSNYCYEICVNWILWMKSKIEALLLSRVKMRAK